MVSNELRRVSGLASELVSYIMDARCNADLTLESLDDRYPQRFVDSLFFIEKSCDELRDNLTSELAEIFSAVSTHAVEVFGTFPSASVHEAILDQGLLVGCIAFDVAKACSPDRYPPGVEYNTPTLPGREDVASHIDVAKKGFRDSFPDIDSLNLAQVLRQQELAKAVIILNSTGDVKRRANNANKSRLFPRGPIDDEEVTELVIRLDEEQGKPKGKRLSQAKIAGEISQKHYCNAGHAMSITTKARTARKNGRVVF